MRSYRESIIIEGPPFSGKTTLAGKLSGVTGLPIKKHDLCHQLTDRQLLKLYLRDFMSFEPLILDSQWISEYLQGPIKFKKVSRFNQISINAFWQIQEALGVATILCLPPWRLIEKSCQQAHLNREGIFTVKKIYLAYETFLKANSNQKILHHYDYEHGSGTYIVHTLLNAVREIQLVPVLAYQHRPLQLKEIH